MLWALFLIFLSVSAGLGQERSFHRLTISSHQQFKHSGTLKPVFSVNSNHGSMTLNKECGSYSKSQDPLQRRADAPDPDDVPVNFAFHNFPSIAFENAAKHGIVDALKLASAALAATDDLTTSYHRYFRHDERDTVRQVFEAIITESVYVQCSDSHEINIWFEDSVGNFDGCAQGLAAYHLTPGPGVVGLNIVLCTELFHLYPNPLEMISRDDLKGYADESMETIGLTVLHELTHLSTVIGGLVISDVYIESAMDVSPSNPLGHVKAYGPYLAMMANKDEHAGSLNADNYAFFAAESFFMQEYDMDSFADPPPSQSSNFHPARSLQTLDNRPVSGRKSAHSKAITAISKEKSDVAVPPYRLPGPGFPQNWIFEEFTPENHGFLDLSIEGIVDAWRLADVAAESLLGDLTASYYRYFQEEDACDVEDVFILILKQASLPPDPTYHARDWKIYYDDATMSGRLCPSRRDLAYFVETPNYASPTIVICPIQFETNSRLLDTIRCSDVEPYASDNTMDNIGATLLHEMLHDYGMTGDANVFASDVQFKASVVNSDGTTKKGYVTGYGPYWSHYLNVNQHAGTSNVDNFVWYALETWFNRVCGIVFGDPAPTPADVNVHALRSLKAAGRSQILGRQLKNNSTNVVRQPQPQLMNVGLLPLNILFSNFPPDSIELYGTAAALLGAFNLAGVALMALDQGLTSTCTRYFQPDQLCIVRNVFQAILSIGEVASRTLPESNRHWILCYGDALFATPLCDAHPNLVLYPQINPEVYDENRLILCAPFFQIHALRAEILGFDCATLPHDRPPWTPEFEDAALVMLHAVLFAQPLTREAADVVISDKIWGDMLVPNNDGAVLPLLSTGPYWSQWVNSARLSGPLNADNYVYFAFEAYLAERCGIELNGFADAPVEPNPAF